MANNHKITNHQDGNLIVDAVANSVILQHSSVTKLETLETGVNITGALTVNNSPVVGGGGLANIVEDTTPQLGGNLDAQAFDITTTGKMLYSNVYDTEGDLPAAGSYHGMFAHVHGTGKAYYAHAGAWVELANAGGGGGGSMASRTTPAGTTSSLANNASADLSITGFKSYFVMSIETNYAAWVRLYISEGARSADAARTQLTDPTPDSGVIAEVVTSGSETVILAPGVIGFNNEASVTTAIPCRVTNLSGSSYPITVTLKLVQLEA
tara:strand:+ start:14121 stop:14921 length:801 start_codon:yes stop_codon:yes gene_type:complete